MKKYYKHVAAVALCLSVATSSFSQATSIFKVDFGTATPNDFLVKSVASPYASIGTGYTSYNGTSAWAYGAYTYINNTNALRAYSNGISAMTRSGETKRALSSTNITLSASPS